MRWPSLLPAVVVLALCAQTAAATDPAKSQMDILVAVAPPRVDGKLDDVVWKVATPVTLARTNEGGKVDKEIQTAAYCVYDKDNLYIAYHCFEPSPKNLKVTVKARDGSPIWEDDEIEYFVDPNHDHAKPGYFQLIVNAANVQFDNEADARGVGWNADWESAVAVGASKDWVVELRVPFKSIEVKATPKPGEVWGMNFTRHVMTVAGTPWTTWSDTGASFHTPSRFGDVTFRADVLAVSPSGKAATTWGLLKAGDALY
jgi:hypothetical protein